MELAHYRYVAFFLTTFLMFHDACSRYIGPLAMIGGMVKKNCSDPLDGGEFCWSDKRQASFIGAFFYGYALQMIPAFFAAKIGFNNSLRFSTIISGIIQLTLPMTVRFSPDLAIVLQVVKGFVAGLFLPGNMECARKWGLGEEGNLVLSMSGIMLFTGSGVGPFMVGMLTERVGWAFPFYISGIVFILLFFMQCLLIPDDPTQAWFMSCKEKMLFQKKQQIEEKAKTGEHADLYKVSLLSILRRRYLYCLCLCMVVHLSVYYPEFTAIPFFFNEFWGADTEFLSYLQLGLSLTTALSVVGWKSVLTFLDAKLSWLKCRISMMIVPLVIRCVCLAIMPFTGNLAVSILLLVVSDIMIGTAFAGGIVTLAYELDPFNGPVVFGIINGVGETSGFLVPLIRAAVTSVDENKAGYWEEYEMRWKWFFVLCGGVGLTGVVSIVTGVLVWRDEWKKHPSLIGEITDKNQDLKGDGNAYVLLDQNNAPE